jgi:HK97 family phage portal protein
MARKLKTFVNRIAEKAAGFLGNHRYISLTDTRKDYASDLLGFKFGNETHHYLTEAYGGNPYVFMPIDRISERFAQLHKILITPDGAEVPPSRLTEMFEEVWANPNPKDTNATFLYRYAASYEAAGETFIVRRVDEDGGWRFTCPTTTSVTINEDGRGNVVSYTVNEFGEVRTYLPMDVLHIYKPDITCDTNDGFSTLRAQRKVWESNNEVRASEAALHKNKGINGILFDDGKMSQTPSVAKEMQKQYDEDYGNSWSFGRVKISPVKLGFVRMGMNPTDLKSVETQIEHLRTICAAFKVDSKLFGDAASSTYNNVAEAKAAFIIDAVLPLADLLLGPLVEFMSTSVLQLRYSMEVDQVQIPELSIVRERKSATIREDVAAGIITLEEGREMLYPQLADNAEG